MKDFFIKKHWIVLFRTFLKWRRRFLRVNNNNFSSLIAQIPLKLNHFVTSTWSRRYTARKDHPRTPFSRARDCFSAPASCWCPDKEFDTALMNLLAPIWLRVTDRLCLSALGRLREKRKKIINSNAWRNIEIVRSPLSNVLSLLDIEHRATIAENSAVYYDVTPQAA